MLREVKKIRKGDFMSKQTKTNLPDVVVKIEKSGVRFNAWDTDGVKRTSEITTGARKKAYRPF